MTKPRDEETPTAESDQQIEDLPAEATEMDEVRGGEVSHQDFTIQKLVDKSTP